MLLDFKIQIDNWIAYTIFGLFFLVAFFNVIIFYSNKQKKAFKSRMLYSLLKNKMSNVQFHKKEAYDLTFKYFKTTYYVKFLNGGKRKGITATNAATIFIQTFKDETSAAKTNELLIQASKFLSLKLEGKKVIVFRGNLMRANKYINENEIEAITFNKETFKTTIVQENEFSDYLLFLKEPPKK